MLPATAVACCVKDRNHVVVKMYPQGAPMIFQPCEVAGREVKREEIHSEKDDADVADDTGEDDPADGRFACLHDAGWKLERSIAGCILRGHCCDGNPRVAWHSSAILQNPSYDHPPGVARRSSVSLERTKESGDVGVRSPKGHHSSFPV